MTFSGGLILSASCGLRFRLACQTTILMSTGIMRPLRATSYLGRNPYAWITLPVTLLGLQV